MANTRRMNRLEELGRVDSEKAFTKKGKKGFLDYFRTGKIGTLVNISGEGIKEVFQENVQQSGEMFVVNKNINDRAARKIMKDTISLQDFIDTTVLSFFRLSLFKKSLII